MHNSTFKFTAIKGRLIIISLCLVLYIPLLYAEEKQHLQKGPQEPEVQLQAQTHLEIEQQRNQAEQQVQKILIRDAIEAVNETRKAMKALAENQTNDGLAAIERATGKINILLARHPEEALLPIDYEVRVIDFAPLEVKKIKEIGKLAKKVIRDKDYPEARLLLQSLLSEIDIRTYNLPLAIYPHGLKEAARLLEQQKIKEATIALSNTLNTIMIINKIVPLPLIKIKALVNEAEKNIKDKDSAIKLLTSAWNELERANELGYINKKHEYYALSKEIKDSEKQVKNNASSKISFTSLKNKLEGILKWHSEK
jgi:hypothetical protein